MFIVVWFFYVCINFYLSVYKLFVKVLFLFIYIYGISMIKNFIGDSFKFLCMNKLINE